MNYIKNIIIGTTNYIPRYRLNTNKSFNLKKNNELMIKCYRNGLRHFDLSPIYGLAEKSFGKVFFKKKIIIDTKLSVIKRNKKKIKKINVLEKIFQNTLINLNVNKVNTLYIHSLKDFFRYKKEYLNLFKKLKTKNKIKKIRFSIYSLNDLKKIIKIIKPDIIQVPFNIFNQDFNNDYVKQLRKKYKIKFYIRSIFLKGLLLSNNLSRSNTKFLEKNAFLFDKYYEFLKIHKITKLEACLFFVLNSNFDKIIVGLENTDQLYSLIRVLNTKNIPKIDFSNLKSINPSLVDLRKWK